MPENRIINFFHPNGVIRGSFLFSGHKCKSARKFDESGAVIDDLLRTHNYSLEEKFLIETDKLDRSSNIFHIKNGRKVECKLVTNRSYKIYMGNGKIGEVVIGTRKVSFNPFDRVLNIDTLPTMEDISTPLPEQDVNHEIGELLSAPINCRIDKKRSVLTGRQLLNFLVFEKSDV